MIIDFSIKNFGPIKDEVTLSFEAEGTDHLQQYYTIEPQKGLRLLKMGLIFGANASGKSTILKALDFLRDLMVAPFDKKNKQLEFRPFLFSETTPNETTQFHLRFFHKGTKFDYFISLNQTHIVEERMYIHAPNKALLFERHTHADKQLTQIRFGEKSGLSKTKQQTLESNTLWNNTVLGGFLGSNLESAYLQKAADWFENVLKATVLPKTDLYGYVASLTEKGLIDKTRLLSFLQKADLRITNFEVQEKEIPITEGLLSLLSQVLDSPSIEKIKEKGTFSNKRIYFQHSIQQNEETLQFTLPYQAESEGTKRYFQFSGLLDMLLNQSIVLPIDEIESSLHPDLLEHFLLSFIKNAPQSQIIATSHHRELLMEKDILRRDVIWFTEKKADGSTDLFSLADFDSSVIRDSSSYYNAYKIGKLGARPELGDTYNPSQHG